MPLKAGSAARRRRAWSNRIPGERFQSASLAWTPGTAGKIQGDVVILKAANSEGVGPVQGASSRGRSSFLVRQASKASRRWRTSTNRRPNRRGGPLCRTKPARGIPHCRALRAEKERSGLPPQRRRGRAHARRPQAPRAASSPPAAGEARNGPVQAIDCLRCTLPTTITPCSIGWPPGPNGAAATRVEVEIQQQVHSRPDRRQQHHRRDPRERKTR